MTGSKKTITNKIPLGKSERITVVIANIVLTIFGLIAIFPCLHVVSKAFSLGTRVTAGQVLFWPNGFQLETVNYILTKTSFFTALKNSLIVFALGTFISMITTITTAYPLSKPAFKGRKVISLLYVISMVFFGGIIPAYMVIRTIGIYNTYWACIMPFAIVQFNMFIVKNYFEGLPESIEESAKIDGAGDIRTLVSIVCPMSKPVLATISLLYAITYWNNYFHVMMYTNSTEMRTVQLYLYDIINNGQSFAENLYSGMYSGGVSISPNVTTDGMVAAAVTMSLIPIIALYPFVQRFMIQGITIGSVKG
ncbi:MAG TPA: carbohydrate ABC transporter permease [Candidatus Limiplasma sp.]|nr:carbohydrate ABC transporter permease [Candidatus Limiplasma sp.]